MDRSDNTHIRDTLEKRLKRRLPDEMWADLEAKRYVDEAEQDLEGAWANLVDEARRLLQYMDMGTAAGSPHRRPAASRRPPIRARGRAFSAWVARLMDEGRGLQHLREWWGGGHLGRDEALERVQTPGWAFVPLDYWRRLGGDRPFGAEEAAWLRYGTSRVLAEEPESRHDASGRRRTIELAHAGSRRELDVWLSSTAIRVVSIDIAKGEPLLVLASPLSLVGGLHSVAEALQREAPWTLEQAALFALTGEAPEIAPLLMGWNRRLASGLRRSTVVLEVEPWVPHAAVAAAYRQAQRELRPGPNRPVRERSSELARFLAQEGWDLSVREQMRRWNARHPAWAEHDPRNFQAHAERARRLVTQPRGW